MAIQTTRCHIALNRLRQESRKGSMKAKRFHAAFTRYLPGTGAWIVRCNRPTLMTLYH